jgi:hypothetical protein
MRLYIQIQGVIRVIFEAWQGSAHVQLMTTES